MEVEDIQKALQTLRQQRIDKYLAVGFTQEQAELLTEEIKMAGMGFGGLF